MSTKETLRLLQHLFTPTPSASSKPSSLFPSLSLPPPTQQLLDTHLSQFAASFPLGGGGGTQRELEAEKERTKWREGLLEIWNSVEPLPGTEGDAEVIGRVSAFLELLGKLSSGVGEDDDSALVGRGDVGSVWWKAVLRRTMLGTSKEVGREEKPRGRKTAPKWGGGGGKEVLAGGKGAVVSGSLGTLRPLTVSRLALAAATSMIVWAMSVPTNLVVVETRFMIAPFGIMVWKEYEERVVGLLKGRAEGYGVGNLEECLIDWGEKSPETFFHQIALQIAPPSPARLPFLSLLLSFLTRHSAKAYHALKTPVLQILAPLCLTSPSPAVVAVAAKSIAIFLATLPVIIGEETLVSTMAVFARVVTWPRLGEGVTFEDQGFETLPFSEETLQGEPPDPLLLFTILYGIYPCNFTAFLRDPASYLAGKGWTGPKGERGFEIDSVAVKDRSSALVRQHTLHPALFTSDLTSELTDTNRWRQLEAADVMAECDRNVIQVVEFRDLRDLSNPPDNQHHDGSNATPAATINTPTALSPTRMTGILDGEMETFGTSGHPTIDSSDDESVRKGRRRIATSRTPTVNSPSSSRSRSRTPLMPHTTHFTNFQALQSSSFTRKEASPLATERGEPIDEEPSVANSRRSSILEGGSVDVSRANSVNKSSGNTIVRLETELLLLKGEVGFQAYLKQLHLAHMGTLHREKVLDSGAEAERQSLYRTIRTLRGQLKQTKSSLDQLRIESAVTKGNWIAHIDDLKEKLKSLREQRVKWESEGARLRAEVEESKGLMAKQSKELEVQGAAFFDLQNQVAVDSVKLDRITEYEARIEALIKTLSVCDEDLHKFAEQRRDMEALVGEWKKSELLRGALEAEMAVLRNTIKEYEDELVRVRNIGQNGDSHEPASPFSKDGLSALRQEVERLRKRNEELEELAPIDSTAGEM